LYAFGGQGLNGDFVDFIERLDVTEGTRWETIRNLTMPCHSVGVL
jgi:hypothetical protein